jgi:hypothetical protein
MAEFTSKVITGVGNFPAGRQLYFVRGASAVNSDTLTVSSLTTVEGAYLVSTTGVAGTCTFATNVITVTNGGALTWTGLAWGT